MNIGNEILIKIGHYTISLIQYFIHGLAKKSLLIEKKKRVKKKINKEKIKKKVKNIIFTIG